MEVGTTDTDENEKQNSSYWSEIETRLKRWRKKTGSSQNGKQTDLNWSGVTSEMENYSATRRQNGKSVEKMRMERG